MHEKLHAIGKVNKKIRTPIFPIQFFLFYMKLAGCQYLFLLRFNVGKLTFNGVLVHFSSCQNTFACRAWVFTGFADSGTPAASSGTASVATGATSHGRVDAIAAYTKTKAIAVNRQWAIQFH